VLRARVDGLVEKVAERILGRGALVVRHARAFGHQDVAFETVGRSQAVEGYRVQHGVLQAGGGKVGHLAFGEAGVAHGVERRATYLPGRQAEVAGRIGGHALAVAVVAAGLQGKEDGVLGGFQINFCQAGEGSILSLLQSSGLLITTLRV
jgi:hypothetical protein